MSSLLRKVVSGTFFLSSSGIVIKAISFVTVIIITRALSVSGYGALMLALTVTGPITFISGLGLDMVITADLAKSLGEKNTPYVKRLMWSYTKTKLLIVVALIILGWFFKPLVVARFGPSVDQYFFILSFWVLVQSLNIIAELILNTHESFKILSYSRVAESVLKFTGIVLVWKTIGISVAWIIAVYTVAKAVALVINVLNLRAVLNYASGVVMTKTAAIFNILRAHGKWEIITQSFISQFMEDGIRPWVIRHFLGLSGFGFISLAGSLYGTLYEFIPIRKVIFPILARLSDEADKAVLVAQKITKYAFISYGAVAIGAFFAVTPVVNIFFPKYHLAIFPFRILLIQFLINAVAMSQPSFLYAHKMQKIIALYSLVNIVSILTLLPLSLIYFGIIGSFIEKTFTMMIGTWLRERLLRRKVGVTTWRWRNLFIFDQYDRYVLQKIKNVIKIRPST